MTIQDAIRIAEIDTKLSSGVLFTSDEVTWLLDQVNDLLPLRYDQAMAVLKDKALQVLAAEAMIWLINERERK